MSTRHNNHTAPASPSATRHAGGRVNSSIMKVAGLIGSLQVVNILCSILRSKLVALWMGPVGFGLFGIFNSAMEMTALVAQLGLRPSAVRELGKADHGSVPALVKGIRRTALVLGCAGGLLTVACSPLLSRISFGDNSWWWAFAWLGVAVALLSVNNAEGAIFQGLSRFRKLARCSMYGSVGGCLVSIPMFYFWRLDSIIPSILAYIVCTWLALGVYREKIEEPRGGLSWRDTAAMSRRLVTFGMYLTVMGVMNYGITYIFLGYLNHVADEAIVGYYHSGSTLINRYAALIITALSMEYLPRLSAHAHSRRRTELTVSNQMFLTMIALTGVLSVFVSLSPLVIEILYSSEFMPVLPFVVLAAAGTLVKAFAWCMSTVMMARGDGKIFLYTELISGVVNISLSIAGFHIGGFAGLGVAYVLWFGIYAAMVWYVYRIRYGMRLHGPVGGVCAAAAVAVLPPVALALAGMPYWGIPWALCAAAWSLVQLRRKFNGQ